MQRLLVAAVTALLLVPPAAGLVGGTGPEADASADAEVRPESHEPIRIVGDENFTAANGVRGGSGTASDPYVIANWSITATEAYGIRIQDTTAHVAIDTVIVDGEARDARCIAEDEALCPPVADGIQLRNVSNVTVRDSLVSGVAEGIAASWSSSFRIDRATVSAGEATVFRGVEDARLSNLTAHGRGAALVTESRNVTIADSTLVGACDCPNRVTAWDHVVDFTFVRNQVKDIGFAFTGTGEDVTVAYNRFQPGNGRGVTAISGLGPGLPLRSLDVCGNSFAYHLRDARESLSLLGVDGGAIRGNVFEVGRAPLHVGGSDDVVVRRNAFHHASDQAPAFFQGVEDVHRNSFEGNLDATVIGNDTDARFNWWGDESGPSGDGPGAGDPVDTRGTNVTLAPWLTSPPETGPDAVDCGVRQGPAGAKERPRFPVSASVEVGLGPVGLGGAS